jgi:hypothetical protein
LGYFQSSKRCGEASRRKSDVAGWTEELGRLLLPSMNGGAEGLGLEGGSQWNQGRLLADGAGPDVGSESAAFEVQKALQLGKQIEALK